MHVIAVVENRLLLDLTLDQCTTPAHPEEKGYVAAPHWTDRQHRGPFVKATLERLRARLPLALVSKRAAIPAARRE
jgi:hypothetical protein